MEPTDTPDRRGTVSQSSLERWFRGSIFLGGEEIPVDLRVETQGPLASGVLTSPVGLSAAGDGVVEGNRLRLEMGYCDECTGLLELDGEVEAGGPLQGTVRAVT